MKMKKNIFFSILLSLAMVLGQMPGVSSTALAYDGNPYASLLVTTDTNKNKSGDALNALQVTFDGKPWYVIADDSTAVDAGTVTLLAADDSFGTSTFDSSGLITPYSSSTVNEYLSKVINGTAGEEKPDFSNVATSIVDRQLYLLDTMEASNIPENVRIFSSSWWLCSPGIGPRAALVFGESGFVHVDGAFVNKEFGVRPALKLKLSAVIFESETKTFTLNLTEAKTNAINIVSAVKAAEYVTADQQTVTGAKNTALTAINAAATTAEINAALNNFKTAIASCTLQTTAEVIAQVLSEVSAAPGSDKAYTSNPIQLINTPTVTLPDGYILKYAVTTENTSPVDDLFTTSIPKATNAGTYYVWYKVFGEGNSLKSDSVCVVVEIAKAAQTAPEAPVITATTSTSITVKTVRGVEFSIDGVNWQTSGYFTGLEPGTTYVVQARKPETQNHSASPASTTVVNTPSAQGQPSSWRLGLNLFNIFNIFNSARQTVTTWNPWQTIRTIWAPWWVRR